MNKISQELIGRCGRTTCCANELVILPNDGDAGFEEYFYRKAAQVREVKHLFVREEQTALILKYPGPSEQRQEFNRFFDSPEVAARNQQFEGCFGIELTDYLRAVSDPKLEDLIRFITRNPPITYVLFAYAHDPKDGYPLLRTLDQYFPLQMIHIPLPDADKLTVCTGELIRGICGDYDGAFDDEIRAFFAAGPAGYDTAEFFVRELREREFRGEEEVLLDTIRYMKDSAGTGRRLGF